MDFFTRDRDLGLDWQAKQRFSEAEVDVDGVLEEDPLKAVMMAWWIC